MNQDHERNNSEKDDYLVKVEKLIKEIRYGSLTLIIQDGKVIQIDRTDKLRL